MALALTQNTEDYAAGLDESVYVLADAGVLYLAAPTEEVYLSQDLRQILGACTTRLRSRPRAAVQSDSSVVHRVFSADAGAPRICRARTLHTDQNSIPKAVGPGDHLRALSTASRLTVGSRMEERSRLMQTNVSIEFACSRTKRGVCSAPFDLPILTRGELQRLVAERTGVAQTLPGY